MSTRLLSLTTLSIGVCLAAFLYLPSLVLALAVGRRETLSLRHGERIARRALTDAARAERQAAAVIVDRAMTRG